EESEQRQQRKPKNGEVIAVNPIKQMDADALELVAADAGERGVAGHVEIIFEIAVGKIAHLQLCSVDARKKLRSVPDEREGRMQFMSAAAQIAQLVAGGGAIDRLGEALGAARESLVRAQNNATRQRRRDGRRLGAGQMARDGGRILDAGLGFDGALVYCRWPDFKAKTRSGKNFTADVAS